MLIGKENISWTWGNNINMAEHFGSPAYLSHSIYVVRSLSFLHKTHTHVHTPSSNPTLRVLSPVFSQSRRFPASPFVLKPRYEECVCGVCIRRFGKESHQSVAFLWLLYMWALATRHAPQSFATLASWCPVRSCICLFFFCPSFDMNNHDHVMLAMGNHKKMAQLLLHLSSLLSH